MTPTARYNHSKLYWEILVEEPQGDRITHLYKEANIAHKMLKEKGVKFVDAKVSQFGAPMLLITDFIFWYENEESIFDWCTESRVQCTLTGMVLEFESQQDKMMFMLRWS